MIPKILAIMFIVLSLVIGWVIPEPYSQESLENGTHMLGLKYMPPCTPFGYADVTCGLDMLLWVAWVICLFVIVIDS